MVVSIPCQLNRFLESFPDADMVDDGYLPTFGCVKGVTGDGDGDISRQDKAFCYDFVACELYVERAVIELLVLFLRL